MKKIIALVISLACFHYLSYAQSQTRCLKIYSITEYIDGYLITAVDTSTLDTLNLISVKRMEIVSKHFKKMKVGEKYFFKYEDKLSQAAAMPPNSFVIRIKTTVVWRDSDDNRKRPVFAQNTIGLWIR